MRIAMIQNHPVFGEKKANVESLIALMESAALTDAAAQNGLEGADFIGADRPLHPPRVVLLGLPVRFNGGSGQPRRSARVRIA